MTCDNRPSWARLSARSPDGSNQPWAGCLDNENEKRPHADAIIDLLFWIAIFVGLFFGLRWMKARRNKDK
jgi:hypothetical protein